MTEVIRITYFVHGTTSDNEKGIASGWRPAELSELGLRQAKELGQLVSSKHFDVIFSSDLKRAFDSATLAFEGHKIIQDKRLRECDYGDLAGTPADSFEEKLPEFITVPFPHGESYVDVERRIADFLLFLKDNYPGKHIAIVAHRAPQLALDVLLKKKTWKQAIAEDWRHAKKWQPGWEYEFRAE